MRVNHRCPFAIGSTVALSIVLCSCVASADPNVLEVGTVELKYQQNERKNAPTPEKFFGKYWGSGNGRITGQLNGAVHWDLYEDQSRDDLHRAQFVGVIVAEDGGRIPFEGLGFYKPREGGYWDFSASFNFDCRAPGCPWHRSEPLLWKGTVKQGEWIHRAHLYSVGN